MVQARGRALQKGDILAMYVKRSFLGPRELSDASIEWTHVFADDSIFSFTIVIVSISSTELGVSGGSGGDGRTVFWSRVFEGEGILR